MNEAIDNSRKSASELISPNKRRLFFSLYILFVLLLLGIGYEVVLYFGYGVKPGEPFTEDHIWRNYYPELWKSGVLDAEISRDDESFDVLLLGASVMEQLEGEFARKLKESLDRPVRVFSLAKSAHTSRDSYFKMKRLREKPFDLIVVYHGINDVRMNCCPKKLFKEDYTHCEWYSGLQRRLDAKSFMLPLSAMSISGDKIPLQAPTEEYLDFGNEIKTEKSFRQNMEAIVAFSEESNSPILLSPFVYHIPQNYTREKYKAGELDYSNRKGSYKMEAENWGHPQNVARTIDAHNKVIEQISRKNVHVLLIDLRETFPRNKSTFSDPCHLTKDGAEEFVEQMISALKKSPSWKKIRS